MALEPLAEGARLLRPTILVVDDDAGLRESFRLILDDEYEVVDVMSGQQALDVVRTAQIDVALLDIRLPEMDGIEVLERLKQIDEQLEVILVTAVKTVKTAVAAMKLGAFDYVNKPFVAVNPAAISESLIESELFGHEKGAFTGAYQRRPGRFELAQGGTLFLDEIGSLKPEMQAKLLRVLQERELERVGGTRTIRLDVRIIAATNVDLRQAVAREAFRADLFYRLNVVPITVPPLRERRTDVPLLVTHFVERYNQELGKRIEGLTPEASTALRDYPWPGNISELPNAIERATALDESGTTRLNDLPTDVLLPDHRVRVKRAE